MQTFAAYPQKHINQALKAPFSSRKHIFLIFACKIYLHITLY